MAKKGRHAKGGRTAPKGTRPDGYRPRYPGDDLVWDEPESDLMDDVRRALAYEHPISVLQLTSSLLALVDPRRFDLFDRAPDDDPGIDRAGLLQTFIELNRLETTALLAAIAALATDQVEQQSLGRVVNARAHQLPAWLLRLGEAEAYRAVEVTHVLRDGDSILIGVRLVTGEELSAVVYIDHNEGTLVKDAFIVPQSIDSTLSYMERRDESPDTSVGDLAVADAKARIFDAIDIWARTIPAIESETWPACRPLLEWVVGLLPDGGHGYQRADWSDAERAELTERFFASEFGAPLDDADHRGLFDSILFFACDYGPGDPMRWSPTAVGLLLDDWIPRKIVADAEYLSRAPEVLRAFIRFCHAERGISAHLTDATVEMVDLCEPDYQQVIRSPRLQGPAAILAAMGLADPDGLWDDTLDEEHDDDLDDDLDEDDLDDDDPSESRRWLVDYFERSVGGPEAMANLDDVPLPDEPFDWTAIAEDIRDRVNEVLTLADGFCDELLDVEHRTAVRRVLARIATNGPGVFRGRSRVDTAAAAICLSVCGVNNSFVRLGRRLSLKALLGYFGISGGGLATRAAKLLDAGGFPCYSDEFSEEYMFASPEYLVSAHRRNIRARWESVRVEL